MEKKRNKKGFTLAELLIVVAIIAVLVAIAIPVFTTQLERSRESTDLANVRSAYAELITEYLTDGSSHSATVSAKQTKANWQTDNSHSTTTIGTNVGSGSNTGAVSVPASTSSYVIKVDTTGAVTVTAGSSSN